MQDIFAFDSREREVLLVYTFVTNADSTVAIGDTTLSFHPFDCTTLPAYMFWLSTYAAGTVTQRYILHTSINQKSSYQK